MEYILFIAFGLLLCFVAGEDDKCRDQEIEDIVKKAIKESKD